MQMQMFGGTISGLIKNMALEHKWQERKKNPYLPKGKEEDPQIAMLRKQAEDSRKQQAISSIDCKLKAGMRLSESEMEYLRAHSPDLYKKAVQVEKEREEYRRELDRCKTKEDVNRLNSQKMQQFMSEAKAISNSNLPRAEKREQLEFLSMRVMAVLNEHALFLKTPEYSALPSEYDENEEQDKKKGTKKISSDESQKLLQRLALMKLKQEEPSLDRLKKSEGTQAQADAAPELAAESGAANLFATAAESMGSAPADGEPPPIPPSGYLYTAQGSHWGLQSAASGTDVSI